MSVVFIHGVNTREGEKYDPILKGLIANLKERVLKPLGWPSMTVLSPYWGKYGVDFHWRPARELAVIAKAGIFENTGPTDGGLTHAEVEVAKEELAGVSAADRQAVLAGLEKVLRDDAALQSAVFETPNEAQAAQALNDAVAKQIHDERLPAANRTRLERLEMPSLSPLADRILRIATAIASNRLRQRLQVNLSRFMGDAFVYARDRGTPDKPGEILRTVAAALREAKSKSEPLVVITYSMGGNIFYDLATAFDKAACECLAWIAVGSQVAHFEDMKLFYASDQAVCYPRRVEKPPQVKYWFNLHDPLDPVAFAAGSVFKEVQDVRYATGVNAFAVHGAYFEQPGFYAKIYELLRNIVPKPE